MIADLDNRIAFPPTLVDFENVVGIGGKSLDSYPSPGEQPRYDWMRLYLIGLLSQQSSFDPPTQYRIGTPWFNKTTKTIYIWDGENWTTLANFIDIGGINLFEFYASIKDQLNAINPTSTFSGHCTATKSTSIPVPNSINISLATIGNLSGMYALVYKNGILVDPRKSILSGSCPLFITLDSTEALHSGDIFTAIIQPINNFVNEEVVVSAC